MRPRRALDEGLRGTVFLWTLAASAAPALAGRNEDAKIACHLVAHVAKGYLCQSPPKPPCNPTQGNFVVHGELSQPYDLYLLVADGDSLAGISAAEFGIDYQGVTQQGMDVLGWTSCADVQCKDTAWPSAGSGIILVWDHLKNCQRTAAIGDLDGGVTAVLGALYVYAFSNDVFKVTKRPLISRPVIAVASCGLYIIAGMSNRDTLDFPQGAGRVAFGQADGGVDPCN